MLSEIMSGSNQQNQKQQQKQTVRSKQNKNISEDVKNENKNIDNVSNANNESGVNSLTALDASEEEIRKAVSTILLSRNNTTTIAPQVTQNGPLSRGNSFTAETPKAARKDAGRYSSTSVTSPLIENIDVDQVLGGQNTEHLEKGESWSFGNDQTGTSPECSSCCSSAASGKSRDQQVLEALVKELSLYSIEEQPVGG